jgi:hypothetical protein
MRNRIHNNIKPEHLFGIGLDNDDGHKRITQGEQFSVLGGSRETHERLTSTFIKTFERLKQKGKRLEQTEPNELSDIIKKASEEL